MFINLKGNGRDQGHPGKDLAQWHTTRECVKTTAKV